MTYSSTYGWHETSEEEFGILTTYFTIKDDGDPDTPRRAPRAAFAKAITRALPGVIYNYDEANLEHKITAASAEDAEEVRTTLRGYFGSANLRAWTGPIADLPESRKRSREASEEPELTAEMFDKLRKTTNLMAGGMQQAKTRIRELEAKLAEAQRAGETVTEIAPASGALAAAEAQAQTKILEAQEHAQQLERTLAGVQAEAVQARAQAAAAEEALRAHMAGMAGMQAESALLREISDAAARGMTTLRMAVTPENTRSFILRRLGTVSASPAEFAAFTSVHSREEQIALAGVAMREWSYLLRQEPGIADALAHMAVEKCLLAFIVVLAKSELLRIVARVAGNWQAEAKDFKSALGAMSAHLSHMKTHALGPTVYGIDFTDADRAPLPPGGLGDIGLEAEPMNRLVQLLTASETYLEPATLSAAYHALYKVEF